MNLFVEYIQPLTDWLQANPHWALFFTFIIALTESLAIIGSIVPGSVTMTAIGILAGSGIMRIDLTLFAAILGAISGDSLSYALGYFYSEQLTEIWPFKKYPAVLVYGKDFFARHGGKSVLLGRFVGPLRSIIPVIAGIMHMKQWRFFTANVLSAIGWALLYVLPGILIGAASHQLSTETATRLFLSILGVLAGVWFISLMIKWLLIKLNSYLKRNLHRYWDGFKKHPTLFKLFNAITPENEENHYPTAGLLVMTVICLISFIVLVLLSINTHWMNQVNIPINLFVQSVHTELLEAFFVICTQLTSTLTIALLFVTCCFWCVYHKNIKTIIYLISIIISSGTIAFTLTQFINNPRPQGLLVTMAGSSFPAFNLVIATAFYGFILFFIKNKYSLLTKTLRSFILIILGLSGLGAVFLSDYWFIDVLAAYLCGATICLIHCIIYRKYNPTSKKQNQSVIMLLSLFAIILFSCSVSTYQNFNLLTHNHTPFHKEFILDETQWWDQKKPILPLYRLNRIGKRISLFNIQYSGDVYVLENSLVLDGWVSHTESFFVNILHRMSKKPMGVTLPLFAQLYENKRPELVMTYTEEHSSLIFELRVWESNYYLYGTNRPLWIGSVHSNNLVTLKKKMKQAEFLKLISPLTYVLPALTKFSVRRIELPKNSVKTTVIPTAPIILLIKNSVNNK